MNFPYVLEPHIARFVKFHEKNDPAIPQELIKTTAEKPNLDGIVYPLPSRKSEYTCFANGSGNVVWYGASTGLTRYDPQAKRKEDTVMYFSAERDLLDNNVKALYADGQNVWVLTETGAAFIEMRMITGEEKANILLEETLEIVDRRGMVSQRNLKIARDFSSKESYAHSDNDGCFTSGFSMGELFHYAVLKREKGENDPETKKIRAVATRAVEACLLLMFIAGRGNGFIARTYLTKDEPVPDDGLFYRKTGGKATCIDTKSSRRRGISGKVIDASAPVPERLARLYTDLGYTDDDITYKGDTSSDEVTLHYLNLLFAHDILGEDDKELDELIKTAAVNSLNHFIDNGYQQMECDGKPTTWAKWNYDYFDEGPGWTDAPLNAAEFLMYLRVVMHITGEKGKWQESFDYLVSKGYAELIELHNDRFWHATTAGCLEHREDLMFGDHALATAAFWGLIPLETDGELRKKYQKGYMSWRTTLHAEHNPFYDFAYKIACPDEEIDMDRIAGWFYRANPSRLASGVSLLKRHDVPVKRLWGGGLETSYLLPQDERFISKYDRNPLEYRTEDSGGKFCVESCYVYTNAYWAGRYYGFIK